MGIGLNSGPVMSGNVGSERRLEYTALGDTTNTASRIEAMSKGTAHQVLLADSTRLLLREPPADLVYVEEAPVRGRTSSVKLWALPDSRAPSSAPALAPQSAGDRFWSTSTNLPFRRKRPGEARRQPGRRA